MDDKYVFGPVPSRRMGLSLGIGPIKRGHCNYACLYCQLGRTKKMTNQVEEYFNLEDILEEVRGVLEKNIDFQVITIVGDGEPLLYSRIGDLISELKLLTKKPIAVITNGALLASEDIREKLLNADIVLPSLDATNEEMFKKINRPFGKIKYQDVLEGIKIFSNEFMGELWIEIMLVSGINDNEKFLKDIKDILKDINYNKVYINTPVRPPAEDYVKEPDKEFIDLAIDELAAISIDKLSSEGFYSNIEDDYEAVLNIIKRHPMNQFEIENFIINRGNKDTNKFFKRLEADTQVEIVNYKNYNTYRLK